MGFVSQYLLKLIKPILGITRLHSFSTFSPRAVVWYALATLSLQLTF